MGEFRLRPTREEFHTLAAEHTVLLVWTELLADLETPVAVYAKLVGDGDGFLLESVEHAERWSNCRPSSTTRRDWCLSSLKMSKPRPC